MSDEGIAQWFGLKRSNFILDPKTDAAFYAPRTGIDIPKLIEGLEVNLVTDRPPKRLFWGLYGGGKTHTIFHINHKLQGLLNVYPVYVECPSVPKKSTFLDLYHDGIMASMGQDFVLDLFRSLIKNIGLVGFDELLKALKENLGDEELSRAVASLLGARPDKELAFWRYISGVSVPARDLAELNQTQAVADSIPSRLANIVIIIGKVVKRVQNQTLAIILDELDRLQYVGDDYGISTYEEAFRRLVDENQRDVAILMSCSAVDIRRLPSIFGAEAGPILSRIGSHNLIQIGEIQAGDVDNFINAVLTYVVNKEKAENKIKKLGTEVVETVNLDCFPFSREAIEALKGKLRGIMTPREITQRMSDAAGKAYLMKKRLVTSDIIA